MVLKIIPNDDPARLARVHDARWLKFGVDREGLANQVDATRILHEQYTDEERKQGALTDAQAQAAELVYQNQQAAYAEAARKLQRDRQEQQGLFRGRDWDLSRPDQLRIDCPARIGDDDPRCGPASIQKFAGEDLLACANKVQQQHANAETWHLQIEQLQKKKEAEVAVCRASEAQIRQLDLLQCAFMHEENLAQQKEAIAVQNLNKELAKQRDADEHAEIEAEKKADIEELHAAQMSPFLNETQTPDSFVPNRMVVSDFKGMSEGGIRNIRDGLSQQLEERKAAREMCKIKEKEDQAAQAHLQLQLRRQLLEAEMANLRHNKKYKQFLEKQIDDKVSQDAAMKALLANRVTPEYFSQFETSHR